MTEDTAVRATSFGGVAAEYDRYRPAPPREAAGWLLPAGARRVVDLCAGTGAFSRVIADLAEQVTAIELDPRMLGVLRQRSDRLLPVCARGEILPLRGSSVDALLVSSAWHWLDAGAAVSEAARVLRSGGVLGVVWSGPRRDIGWVSELLGQRRADSGRARRRLEVSEEMPFHRPENHVFEWSLWRTPAELVGLAGTYSRVIIASAEERETVSERAAQIAAAHPELHVDGRIELPMRTVCWKSVRL
jgi:SAM-dependent methyltransferase